jgi:hypothetical protein
MPTSPDPTGEGIWAGAGPWARVTLPRGQVIRVIVTGRRRVKGGWWAECEALLWMRSLNPDGTSRPEPAPVTFTVPFDHLEPIGGQDYRCVPTIDETLPRPWWLQIHTHAQDDATKALLHRKGCGQAPNPSLPCTDSEVIDEVKGGGVVPWTACRPERAPLWLKYPPRPGG